MRGSQLVDITFDSADPEFAARAANAFAEEYVGHNLALKVESLEKSAEWLTGEVQKQADLMARATWRWRSTRKRRTPAHSTATRTSWSRG